MGITLRKADGADAAVIHEMQVRTFLPLLEKYQDAETSPANEPVERVLQRIEQPQSDYYIIQNAGVPVGGIRVRQKEVQQYWISPVFILPEYQGLGIAQAVFGIIEELYPEARVWGLATILQEERNCYLYEKLGYTRTGEPHPINDKLTIVGYEKLL
ncbi:GNAT family N-acetyltransferase ['Paenibacillus yunnanensis' Narsing Rao et al. 2020]|uniref:GNAT family N-acetyltransferase n=1 Tax=Paenibacillus tengchongensis TaxID=2608684 RepID=UPI00124D15A6|nr:GNAT family N-acetyltransferase [Paenibacillus tengchongensis]